MFCIIESVVGFAISLRSHGQIGILNIVANSCRNCFVIEKWYEKCVRGFKNPICMKSILPNFVANTIKENLRDII